MLFCSLEFSDWSRRSAFQCVRLALSKGLYAYPMGRHNLDLFVDPIIVVVVEPSAGKMKWINVGFG